MAHLVVIYGPMFSGKSTELLRRVRRYGIAFGSNNILCVKARKDNRYSITSISTHDQASIKAVSCVKLNDLDDWQNYNVIAIDEGQFFDDIVPFTKMLLECGKKVIVSGLDGDFQMKPFKNNILDLIPLANESYKLNAVCMICKEDAPFTKRTTANTQQEVVGGDKMYMATCRKCHSLKKI